MQFLTMRLDLSECLSIKQSELAQLFRSWKKEAKQAEVSTIRGSGWVSRKPTSRLPSPTAYGTDFMSC